MKTSGSFNTCIYCKQEVDCFACVVAVPTEMVPLPDGTYPITGYKSAVACGPCILREDTHVRYVEVVRQDFIALVKGTFS